VFRFASGTTDLTRVQYSAYCESLHTWAVGQAYEDGLNDGSNRAARCRRFVRTVDGKVYKRSRSGAALPEPWRELANAAELVVTNKSATRCLRDIRQLAAALGPLGIRSPVDMPDRLVVTQLLLEAHFSQECVAAWLSSYNRARAQAMILGTADGLPDINRCASPDERGLRSLPDIAERLRNAGNDSPPSEIPMEEIIRLLAPRWHAAMAAYGKENSNRSDKWYPRVALSSSRILAELVRSGVGELVEAHPLRLIMERRPTGEVVSGTAPGGDDWATGLVDLTACAEYAEEKVTEPLLMYLARLSARDSATNSKIRIVDEDDGPYWTETVQRDVFVCGRMALSAGSASRIFKQNPHLLLQAESELTAFQKKMCKDNSERRVEGEKAKAVLLNLATYPMVLFIGLPALRKFALRRGADLESALGRYGHASHPKVRRAESAYHTALENYVIMCFFCTDGLRLANYTFARLGSARHDAMISSTAPCGTAVNSFTHVSPIMVKGRLADVRTNFFGDDHSAVKLKIAKIPGSHHWRERPHALRPGLVDFDLLQEYLTTVRAARLAKRGFIALASHYDLMEDVTNQHFALFISPCPSSNPYCAVTGAYNAQCIEARFCKILHWMCTIVLGRDLPPLNSEEFKKLYPGVFAPHVTRLWAGSYIYGILGRADVAQALLNDALTTIQKSYSVVEADMVHKTGWEDPHFFDSLFSRAWDKRERIDWDSEDLLAGIPLDERPPGLPAVR
jgi:hypothetical protein